MPLDTNPTLVDATSKQLKITDVIIHLKYTTKVDRGAFKQQVQNFVKQSTSS